MEGGMMNIYETINKVIEEVGAIGKEKKSSQNYLYRGVDDVMNALQPLFAEHKLFVVPEVLEQSREERVTKNGGNLIYSILKMKYTFYAEDGSNVSAITIGEGMDNSDKSSNKAMSVAFKYACFQVFCIPTEEMKDPDDENPPDNKKAEPKKQTDKPDTDKPINEPLMTETQRNALISLDVDLLKLAMYHKTSANKLTEAQAQDAIQRKQNALKKQEDKKKQEEKAAKNG